MTRLAIAGILAIFLISVLAVIYINSFTGAYSSSYGYGASKLYGGGAKKAAARNPAVLGKNYEQALFTAQMQQFMYSNQDKWECTFGPEAEKSGYPCIYDENLKKYCCITTSAPSGIPLTMG